MKIAVIGATGMAGSRIAAEAARRGHSVTGYSRSASGGQLPPAAVSSCLADATDARAMSCIAARNDVIVLATRPVPGAEGEVGAVVTTVLDAALDFRRRVLIIGGAAPLRAPDSEALVIDDTRFVPAPWRAIAQASVDQFNACTPHAADWTNVSPPALFEPGTTTGSYRRGGSQLLIDANGASRISAEDLAIAVLDEIENPRTGLRHFTVAY